MKLVVAFVEEGCGPHELTYEVETYGVGRTGELELYKPIEPGKPIPAPFITIAHGHWKGVKVLDGQ